MQTLKQALETFNQKNTFKPGDIVDWKPGMAHKDSEGPFVVVELLDEPLDLVLGCIDKDGYFIIYHYDSRRMQPVNE